MNIQQTTDYTLFKEISSNRDVDRKHARKLADSIRRKNLLSVNPIIVNQRMEILDGQHRLAAAKFLKVPIYYVVGEDIHHDDIAKLNTNKKNWVLMDYINYYTVKGRPEFKELSKLINEYQDLPVTFITSLISDEGRRQSSDIVEGRLNIGNLRNARTVITYIEDFATHFEHAYNSRFLEAMLFITNTGLYNHETMMAKIERNPGALIPCANKKQYIKLLQDIYNKGTHEKNIALFIKR